MPTQVLDFFPRRRWMRKKGSFIVAGCVLGIGLVAFFILLAREVQGDSSVTRFDTRLGEKLGGNRETTPVVRALLMAFTLLAAFETLLILVPLGALIFWLKKQRTVAIIWVLIGAGVGFCNSQLKHHFDRDRPPFKDRWVYEDNESFPSGHSSGSMALFGLLGYLMVRATTSWRIRVLIIVGTALLILAVGFSRIYLGAHYFSDVIGGYLLGTVWLLLGIGLLECTPARPATAS
jgi:undecaprenyl-diphosphatase